MNSEEEIAYINYLINEVNITKKSFITDYREYVITNIFEENVNEKYKFVSETFDNLNLLLKELTGIKNSKIFSKERLDEIVVKIEQYREYLIYLNEQIDE